ncbi:MAG: hypothetical protein LAT68_04115 [Cyclobacteriaceae bacterium]|nr:hypothetical protein [Cyclobacteriaceae bacterium]MCH8515494.1 hypothetical protein [Cyclobacteriaceae bacterium]
MKFVDAVLFSSGVAFFIIGVHQLFVATIAEAYWAFMVSVAALVYYGYRKNNVVDQKTDKRRSSESKNKKIRKKR